jgi:hypothetical protein
MANEIQVAAPSLLSPMEMVQIAFAKAVEQGAAAEMVTLILDQQRWLITHTEEENFNAALKRIQKNLKSISKRGWNPDTQSKFATSEDIDSAIQQLLDDENMTLTFVPEDSPNADEVVIVGCLSLGAYTKKYPLPMPADGKGPKGGGVMSRTHATGSAITYGKRYLKNMIFDLRFKETDDDGNGANGVRVPSEKVGEWMRLLEEASDLTVLMKQWGKIYTTANELGDKNALDILIPAYEARKAELA